MIREWWRHFFPERITLPHLCGHEAIYCAGTARDNGHGNRIWVGPVEGEEKDHAQAQAKINGVWEWLEMEGREVVVGEIDRGFAPSRKYALENFWVFWRAGKRRRI
ncbi:MAG: hypothetical protein SV375_00115 [Thermodesulfobacteriota bacterium]|nr:hypothetical protein [Thermodesulfobacteriota bacterium]